MISNSEIKGDVLSWEDYYQRVEECKLDGIMIARGALMKVFFTIELIYDHHLAAMYDYDFSHGFLLRSGSDVIGTYRPLSDSIFCEISSILVWNTGVPIRWVWTRRDDSCWNGWRFFTVTFPLDYWNDCPSESTNDRHTTRAEMSSRR